MNDRSSQSNIDSKGVLAIRRLYDFLAARPYSVIMFGALFCTLTVKFFHSWRNDLVNEYFGWVLADISVLLGFEVILALVCFGWPRNLVVRLDTIFAAVICTWSVMNAGWLIRMGWQILPSVLLSVIRDPISALGMTVSYTHLTLPTTPYV